MSRLRLREVVVVEGRYDATALAGLVDALILTTDGFSIFSDHEMQALLRALGRERGLLILTDSDAAGFRIRHYIEKIAAGCSIKHAYIPAVAGKEGRKSQPSKEGTLGVEGMPPHLLLAALEKAGVRQAMPRQGREITYTDLYELGLSGGAGSAEKRRSLLARLGLPTRLSKRALCQVLNSLYTYEEFAAAIEDKPVLFWDFHGTLTLPDVTWFDAALEAARELVPEYPLAKETLVRWFSGTCLPWWSIPDRDTRHLTVKGAWWGHCEREFEKMFMQCGFSESQAKRLAPALRAKVLEPKRYQLYPDAVPTLQALQRRGYESYILSNNFPELEEVVAALGLAPYFKKTLVSAKIGYDKPRREIYEAALQTAGDPAKACMIGDNPVDDIQGAKQAGLVAIAVHTQDAGAADHYAQQLSDILEILP